jgi:hypothetical protein
MRGPLWRNDKYYDLLQTSSPATERRTNSNLNDSIEDRRIRQGIIAFDERA